MNNDNGSLHAIKGKQLMDIMDHFGDIEDIQYRMDFEKSQLEQHKQTVAKEKGRSTEGLGLINNSLSFSESQIVYHQGQINIYDISLRKILRLQSELEGLEQAQRDHEEKLAIIAHETARENRLAAEAAAKVAATAQEQASQSVDRLLKGLQSNGDG